MIYTSGEGEGEEKCENRGVRKYVEGSNRKGKKVGYNVG